ncbi:hypothetical protein ACWDUL_21265 [Nocardia niigatensis]
MSRNIFGFGRAKSAATLAARALFPAEEALSPADQLELAQLTAAKRGAGPEPDYFPARVAYLEATTAFRSDLLAEPRKGLEGMSVQQLIKEISHAQTHLREERRYPPAQPYGTPEPAETKQWEAHLGALKAEFDRLHRISRLLPELDRMRLEVAYDGVHYHNAEWPAAHTRYTTAKPQAAVAEPNPDPETSMRPQDLSEAARIADQFEQGLFDLYNQVNGPGWGDAYEDAEDVKLVAAIRELETKADAHLAAHRGDLAADPKWAARAAQGNYYASRRGEEGYIGGERVDSAGIESVGGENPDVIAGESK